jgi:hypothetical protein
MPTEPAAIARRVARKQQVWGGARSRIGSRGDADSGASWPASDASGNKPTGQNETEPTDERWFDSFPIREQFSIRSTSACDALAHRELRRLLERLLAQGLTEDDLRRARSGLSNWVGKRLTLTLSSLCDQFDPATRVLCEKCHGSGASTSMNMECAICEGAGFLPPLVTPSRTNRAGD